MHDYNLSEPRMFFMICLHGLFTLDLTLMVRLEMARWRR